MTTLRFHRRLQYIFTSIIILYALIGTGTWYKYQLEFFPIYSWDLFSYVPNDVVDVGLKIIAIDGLPLADPAFFEQAPHLFTQAQDITVFANVQALGRALDAGKEVEANAVRQQIETSYFSQYQEVVYQVVRRFYEPRQRWLTGTIAGEEILAEFIYIKPELEE